MEKKPPSVNDLALSMQNSEIPHELLVKEARLAIAEGDWERMEAVSYTHLTLPTIYSV